MSGTESIKDGMVFEGRVAIGYDHGYDAGVFYLGLALDPAYVEDFVEGCLEAVMNLLRNGLLIRETGGRTEKRTIRVIRIPMRFFNRVHNTL